MSRERIITAALAVTVCALVAAPHSALGADTAVVVRDFEFVDAGTGTGLTSIEVGDTVTWTWESGVHSATNGVTYFADPFLGPREFDSGVLATSQNPTFPTTFSHTFNAAGRFIYYCQVHDWMRGVVAVD